MVACDGIWDCVSNEQCCEKLNNYIKMSKPDESSYNIPVEHLFDNILAPNTDDGIGTDNMTAILIKIN